MVLSIIEDMLHLRRLLQVGRTKQMALALCTKNHRVGSLVTPIVGSGSDFGSELQRMDLVFTPGATVADKLVHDVTMDEPI
ncbi:hypothetical protein L1987_13405 [Smallanthus sonchifolius]|uniref:Uncharacterized protein n=1 Tax=Smallanthus sonchifolius TaxID=185202 RepID=A0ACB9JGF9_9ASTR|nr:hypothetical protein L1987_13405 [Smallanthus sonchifolius]